MKGFIFKIALSTFTSLLTTLLPSLLCADNSYKTKLLQAKMGCMACHQRTFIPPVKVLKQSEDNPRRAKQQKSTAPR